MSYTMLTLYEILIWNVNKVPLSFHKKRAGRKVYVNGLADDPAVFIVGILLLVA
jgi:hypothetical protein